MKRLQERIDDPSKHWKFEAGDLEVRRHWDDYQQAYAQFQAGRGEVADGFITRRSYDELMAAVR